MTGVFHHTQAGEVAETWSMSSSVLLQTESINIEVFSRSTELRGEVLESQQRLSELHRELMRATAKEERERENYPIPEAERITRLALQYFGGPEEVEIDSAVNDLFRRVVAEFAKQEGEHRDELERSRRQTERAGTRFLTELERHVKTFTPVDEKRGPVTYFALDPGWLQVRGRLPGADLAEPDSDDAYIFEPAEVIRRFVQSAVASFDLPPKEAITLADELYSVLEKMPIPVYGSVPESIKPFGSLLSSAGFVGAIGYSSDQNVTLICLSAGAAFLFWFGRPHATTLRDATNEWWKKWLNSKLRLDGGQDTD